MKRKVYNIGLNDYNGKIFIDGRHIESYIIWRSILRRCYDPKSHEISPAYIGCEVCEDWKYFSKFKDWYDSNYPQIDGIKFHLDKDLLGEDSKIYSPETCIFLPARINTFLTNKKENNSSGHTGVSWKKSTSKWIVQIRDFETSKLKYLGYFDNIDDASNTYKVARTEQVEKAKNYMRSLGVYDEEIISKIK